MRVPLVGHFVQVNSPFMSSNDKITSHHKLLTVISVSMEVTVGLRSVKQVSRIAGSQIAAQILQFLGYSLLILRARDYYNLA